MIAQEHGRPETSDIHAVLAEVDAAIAMEARKGRDGETRLDSKDGGVSGTQMLTCIVCDRAFDSAANDPSFDSVPYAGTLFYSRGHYGSTVFDPMDGTQLEIVVCDECLVGRHKRTALCLPSAGTWRRADWGEGQRFALAAATGTAKTPKAVECEASQSGGEAVTPEPTPHQDSQRREG